MKHDMKTIREALQLGRFPSLVPEKMLADAIDELEALRADKAGDAEFMARLTEYLKPMGYVDGKPILPVIGALRFQLEGLRAEVDAAKAEAARLRQAATAARESLLLDSRVTNDTFPARVAGALNMLDAALAATDSGAWLAKHDEEVRAPLERRIAELEASEAEAVERAQEMEMRAATMHENARATYASMRKDIDDALEKNAELTQQLNTLLGGA